MNAFHYSSSQSLELDTLDYGGLQGLATLRFSCLGCLPCLSLSHAVTQSPSSSAGL